MGGAARRRDTWWWAWFWLAFWQVGLVVAVTGVVCRRTRIGPATAGWLWRLVHVKAVLLLLWPLPLQLFVLPAPRAAGSDPVPALGGGGNGPGEVLALLGCAAWLAGLAVLLTRGLRGWRAPRALRAASVPCTDRSMLDAASACARALGLARRPGLRVVAGLGSPLVSGLRRPTVLLPPELVSDGGARRLLLAHETAHIRRRDIAWSLLQQVVQIVLWQGRDPPVHPDALAGLALGKAGVLAHRSD